MDLPNQDQLSAEDRDYITEVRGRISYSSKTSPADERKHFDRVLDQLASMERPPIFKRTISDLAVLLERSIPNATEQDARTMAKQIVGIYANAAGIKLPETLSHAVRC